MNFLDLASLGVVGTLPAVTAMSDFLTAEKKNQKKKWCSLKQNLPTVDVYGKVARTCVIIQCDLLNIVEYQRNKCNPEYNIHPIPPCCPLLFC